MYGCVHKYTCKPCPFWLTSSSLVVHKGIYHMQFNEILESMVMPVNTSTDIYTCIWDRKSTNKQTNRSALHNTQVAPSFILVHSFFAFSLSLSPSFISISVLILHSNHFEILLGKSGLFECKLNKGQLSLTNACIKWCTAIFYKLETTACKRMADSLEWKKEREREFTYARTSSPSRTVYV